MSSDVELMDEEEEEEGGGRGGRRRGGHSSLRTLWLQIDFKTFPQQALVTVTSSTSEISELDLLCSCHGDV